MSNELLSSFLDKLKESVVSVLPVSALVAAHHDVTTVCYFEYSGEMVAQYERAGSRVVCMSSSAAMRPHGVWSTLRFLLVGLRRVVKQVRPEVAHVQYMAPGALPIIVLRQLGVKTIIATAHTTADIYSPMGLRLLRFVQRHLLTAFTCITERAELSFFGSSQLYAADTQLRPRGNHFTLYNCLPSYMPVAPTPKTFDQGLTIGVVSRLVAIKGMDLVVPAFAAIHSRHPYAQLLVVGDGPLRSDMERQVARHGLDDCVHFMGLLPQSALPSVYDRFDMLLMPSRSEGFGLTALEAMARGCVVVAARVGGLPEVVSDGLTGLLHDQDNVDDIVAQACRLIESPQLMRTMSQAALSRAALFGAPAYNALMTSLYNKL